MLFGEDPKTAEALIQRIIELKEKINSNSSHINMLMKDNHEKENEINRLLGFRNTDGDI